MGMVPQPRLALKLTLCSVLLHGIKLLPAAVVAGLYWLPFLPLVIAPPHSPASALALPPASHMHAVLFLERGPRFPSFYRPAWLPYPKQLILLLFMPWPPERKGRRTSSKGVRQELQPSLAFMCPCGELSCKGGWKHAQQEVVIQMKGNYGDGCCRNGIALPIYRAPE